MGAHDAQSYLEGPKSIFAVIGVLLVLCFILMAVGFSKPLERLAPDAGAYHQSGSFSYSAAVVAPTSVYPSGFVTTGEPIYSGLVNSVNLHFAYDFSSSLPHHIKGTIEVKALLLSQTDTWQELSTVAPLRAFSGDSTSVISSLPLDGLYTLINTVSTQSGNADADYTADIQPLVHITGKVGSTAINDTFSPVLPFSVTKTTITLDVATAAVPPGATYVPPSANSELAATLHPVQAGSVPHLVTSTVSVAKYTLTVSALRVLGIVFGVLALAMVMANELVRRRTAAQTKEQLIAGRLHSLIVPVESVSDTRGQVSVADFADLAGLARFLERPILYEEKDGRRTFVVDDDTHRYIHRPVPATVPPVSPRAVPTGRFRQPTEAPDQPTGRVRRRILVLRSLIVVVVLVVVSLAVTSFTASTNVPASSVGTSKQALVIAQLTPGGCAALSLTSMLIHSGTFSNAASHVLVLGGATGNTITDTGTGNCIVAGGGTNAVTGTASDICVSGPSLNLATACPTAPPPTTTTTVPPTTTTTVPPTTTTTTTVPVSNGVTAAPAADNYNNYGGQERLALNNTSSITAMTATITVAQTPGITYASQANSYPGGAVTQSSTNPNGSIVYTFVLGAGQTIASGYQNGVLYAQFNGTGGAHNLAGDSWSVTTTSGGVTTTLTGVF